MGLFGKAKDAQKQAQQAMANFGGMGGMQAGGMAGTPGMSGMDMAAMAAESQKINKINQAGIEAPAVIRSIRVVGEPDMSGGSRHHFDVTIAPDGGAPYETTVDQVMLPFQMESITEGAAVTVKFDPDNPAAAIISSW